MTRDTEVPARSVVLFGDSMLGRFTKGRIEALERAVGRGAIVYNCAAGGWTSADGAPRAATIARLRADVVVLSFGTNDCAPERLVPLADFEANLRSIAAAFAGSATIALLPPSVVEVGGVGPRGRTNAELERYRAVLRGVVGSSNAVETDGALAALVASGAQTHDDDGLHLNDAAYDSVIAATAARIDAAAGPA